MADIKLDQRAFHRRARQLLDGLAAGSEEYAGADALCFMVGSGEDAPVYSKSIALQTWLLGYEFPDTITAVVDGKIVFLTTTKKGAYLDALQGGSVPIEILKRTKDEAHNESLNGVLIDILAASKNGKKLGVIVKDEAAGKAVDSWKRAMAASPKRMEQVDVSPALSVLFAAKDEDELRTIRSAAKISSATMKNFFIPQMSSILDENRKVSHEKLMTQMEDTLLDETKSKKLKLPADTVHSLVDWCYPPIIQSGGKYDLRPSASSNQDLLHEGTIVCSLGVRYRSYCSNVGRTFLMNPTKDQEENYNLLVDLQSHLLTVITDGVLSSDVYQMAIKFIEEKRPKLKSSFVKNCGFVIGIEFRESQYLLAPKTSRPLKAGMTLNLAIGFQSLENPQASDSKNKVYALYLADTILVTAGRAEVLTEVEKELDAITYTFGDEDDGQNEKLAEPLPKKRGAVIDSKLRDESDRLNAEQKRRMHQKQLAHARQEDGLARYSDGKDGRQQARQSVFRKFESYRKENQLPRNVGELRILVDRRAESVLLPIFGQSVPFHISTLKNVSKSDEQDFVLLRFNFVTPGQSMGKKEGPVPYEDANATFVRSLSFRSNDIGRFTEIYREISELKKEMQKRDAERLEMADLVEQANLVEIRGRRPIRLPDVFVRPGLEGKRFPGDLEIHVNGLRYQSQLKSDQKIDILFTNIKHLFFQPCDGELIVLLHVHLRNPIMIGKKKTRDIQFYREVSDASFDETGNRRRRVNYGDEDELAQEQEERRKRQLLNREFQQFSEKIGETSKSKLEVDVPFRDLAFPGVPFRQLVLLQPTTECLVHLSDTPFLVITLADIEIAHLERVQFGLKNFDLVFVFKDFHRPVVHINTIPVNQLENVKEWLDSADIPFSEGPVNLSWPQIMKTINDDPKAFFEEAGGWSFLQAEGSDQESSEESASEFEMSGSEFDESESDSDDSDMDSDASGSDFSESGSGSEEEESGEDWDELERQAEQHDRKRREREDNGDRRPAKKGKGGR
ncbi:FACT complex subunit spt16 [Polyrhizophydium stewartii]|uniref:FACT complex subunit n=1 Tax=Polyrhizophydium stewartii TaxID=2732419 RepID=A0ABR4N468_9FUNG